MLTALVAAMSAHELPGIYYSTAPPETDTLTDQIPLKLYTKLQLFNDHTFEEENENFQCFARPLDRSGNWLVMKDTLVLQVKRSYTKKEGGSFRLSFADSTIEKYRIRGDSLIALHGATIVLVRK